MEEYTHDGGSEISYTERVPNLSHKDKLDEVAAALQSIIPNELFVVQSEAQRCFQHMMDIRQDGAFCDVTFVVKGNEFRAHKVVVSGWSRWLHGILAEAPNDDIVTLDVLWSSHPPFLPPFLPPFHPPLNPSMYW